MSTAYGVVKLSVRGGNGTDTWKMLEEENGSLSTVPRISWSCDNQGNAELFDGAAERNCSLLGRRGRVLLRSIFYLVVELLVQYQV